MEATVATHPPVAAASARRKPFYRTLWGQVLLGVAVGIVLGLVSPSTGEAMQPLGLAFIRLITMIIPLVIFCTIAAGIAGMDSMKKVGRVGGKALIYFEVATSLALVIGLAVGALTQPGAGFNADPATLNADAVAGYAGQAKAQTITDFLVQIIPTSVIEAFARGSILSVVFVSVLFGFALSTLGSRVKPLLDMLDGLTQAVFAVVNILMRLAPIGAFGAMAFTIGRFGPSVLGSLAQLIVTLWIVSALFVVIVLGGISLVAGFNIIRFLKYIREEIVLVLSLSSSDPVLPSLMKKLEKLGCSKGLVGLVTPTGYVFNPGRQLPLHGPCGRVRRPGHQHDADSDGLHHSVCGRSIDTQGRERRAGRVLHRACRHTHGDPVDPGGRHGADSRRRPIHEHVPRHGQRHQQRCGDAGRGTLGERARRRDAAIESGSVT